MNRIICFCSNVKEKEIAKAVKGKSISNLKDIQHATGAATGCGRCIPAIDILLKEEITKLDTNPQKKLF